MGPFDHVTVLLSFVYALALTHLLTRMGSLLVARRRVVFSGERHPVRLFQLA
jgi:hypothetical protein